MDRGGGLIKVVLVEGSQGCTLFGGWAGNLEDARVRGSSGPEIYGSRNHRLFQTRTLHIELQRDEFAVERYILLPAGDEAVIVLGANQNPIGQEFVRPHCWTISSKIIRITHTHVR